MPSNSETVLVSVYKRLKSGVVLFTASTVVFIGPGKLCGAGFAQATGHPVEVRGGVALPGRAFEWERVVLTGFDTQKPNFPAVPVPDDRLPAV